MSKKNNMRLLSQLMLVCLSIIILSSCSTHTKKDGPPNFYVDETKIHNAVPRPEPLAKYGNMPSYRVFGRRYYVLKSYHYYDEVGIASWYGTKFHARRTSSGEPYNMLSMTAAHKTLPLPTYVQVTNLKNHRKVIVKVNDRGPFAEGRIIDLSYVAAKKLGITGHGTALVRVHAIDPYTWGRLRPSLFAQKPTYRKVKQTSPPRPLFANKPYRDKPIEQTQSLYLQVGAFRDQDKAQNLRNRLLAYLNTPVQIQKPIGFEKYYRVQIGPFKDIETADKMTTRLKNLGIKSSKKYGASYWAF